MSLLFDVLFAWKASSTHHKIALDALGQLQCPGAERWQNLFLKHADAYLDGAKAPDTTFKDFKNHVLHVRENYWGGAAARAREWYDHTVELLHEQKWSEAVYNAGVLSHYYTDPLMPLHTGQHEREGSIHRAVEWSVTKFYVGLRRTLLDRLGGWPKIESPNSDDWLQRMVTQGAELANPYYEVFLDHYNLKSGVKDPPAGLDDELKEATALLIGHAVAGFARILERAFTDADVNPPQVNLTLESMLATLSIPTRWLTSRIEDSRERTLLKAMYQEYLGMGKVVRNLPEDDKMVRAMHAKEVLHVSLTQLDTQLVEPVGSKHGQAGGEMVREAA